MYLCSVAQAGLVFLILSSCIPRPPPHLYLPRLGLQAWEDKSSPTMHFLSLVETQTKILVGPSRLSIAPQVLHERTGMTKPCLQGPDEVIITVFFREQDDLRRISRDFIEFWMLALERRGLN